MKTEIVENIICPETGSVKDLSTDHPFFDAAAAIAEGKLVAFPTETVYGLGANATDPEAVKKIYEVKGRPGDNPLIVHVSDKDMIPPLVKRITPAARLLIEAFMPGPITLVMEKSSVIPEEITAGLDTVAIRIPSHKAALVFLETAGLPVAAPSANISGKPSPTSLKHVVSDLFGKIDYIIDGGYCEVGVESTVVDTTGFEPVILRPGYITEKQIEKVCGIPGKINQTDSTSAPRSPGMKYRHYAPEALVYPMFTEKEDAGLEKTVSDIKKHISIGRTVGIYSSESIKENINNGLSENEKNKVKFISFGEDQNIKSALSLLFYALRKMDELGADIIMAQTFSGEGLEAAYMNRLLKASGREV